MRERRPPGLVLLAKGYVSVGYIWYIVISFLFLLFFSYRFLVYLLSTEFVESFGIAFCYSLLVSFI